MTAGRFSRLGSKSAGCIDLETNEVSYAVGQNANKSPSPHLRRLTLPPLDRVVIVETIATLRKEPPQKVLV